MHAATRRLIVPLRPGPGACEEKFEDSCASLSLWHLDVCLLICFCCFVVGYGEYMLYTVDRYICIYIYIFTYIYTYIYTYIHI